METAFPLTWFGSWNEKMQTSQTKMSCKTWWGLGGVFVSSDLRRTNEQLFYRRLNISKCYTLWFWGQSVILVRRTFKIWSPPNVQISVPSEVSSQQSFAAPRAFYFGADFGTYIHWMYLACLCSWNLGVISRGPRNLQLVYTRILLCFLVKFLQPSTQ